LAMHFFTCLFLNARFIAPALAAFHNEYFATMQSAAEYLSAHVRRGDPVLVEIDIGVLSYCADGRFVIADGGGLASPELAHKTVDEHIALVRPVFLVESQGERADDWQGKYGGLEPRWRLGYKGHGVSTPEKLYANIYAIPATLR
jgi:hypothetical protein